MAKTDWLETAVPVSGLIATGHTTALDDGRIVDLSPDHLGTGDTLTITLPDSTEPILSLNCRPMNQDDWNLAVAILQHLGLSLPR